MRPFMCVRCRKRFASQHKLEQHECVERKDGVLATYASNEVKEEVQDEQKTN